MATFTRKGLHKLECAVCDGFLYATVAVLESRGLPTCWCGDKLHPTELELAMILEDDAARPMVEYRQGLNSVAKGQQSHIRLGHNLHEDEMTVAERVEQSRQAQDRRRRRRVVAEPIPF